MKNDITTLERVYSHMTNWLDGVKKHELVNIIEIIEEAKKYAMAAESLSEEKIKQFVDNFNYELNDFYKLNQKQAQESLYLGLLNETWWQTLSQITDRSQVEWAELCDDFDHQGLYQHGDVIGFGILSCDSCKAQLSITHLTQVTPCIYCEHESFTRLPLNV